MPVKRLLREVDAEELTGWLAYYSVDPFGEERADLRNALLCLTTASPYTKPGARLTLEQFIPKFGREPVDPAKATERMMLESLARARKFGRVRVKGNNGAESR